MKTHADKIGEAVTDLGEAKPSQIMDWIRTHYPDDPVNPQSYRADIIGCSKNHSSQHHYPNMPKFLIFNPVTKTYRIDHSELLKSESTGNNSERMAALLDVLDQERKSAPEERPEEVKQNQNELQVDAKYVDGIPISKLSITGQVEIPQKIREKMGLNPGDTIAFIETEKGIQIRKARLKLEFS